MNSKKCIFCHSNNLRKKGFQNNHQVWECKECNKKFQSNRKAPPSKEELFYEFAFHKQTLKELRSLYHVRSSNIQSAIDQFTLPTKVHSPRPIHAVVDATYFGHRENMFCLTVIRDPYTKENLCWYFGDTEREVVYHNLRLQLENLGYTFLSVTGDGLALIRSAFRGIPFQMCLVHMERIVLRGTTKKPKLEAGKVLLAIGESLHTTNSSILRSRMSRYTLRYFSFLNEKTVNEVTGERWFTHDELRKAFVSLQNLYPFLFTYEINQSIPKTTNSLEGIFTHIKNKLKSHNGLSPKRKKKLIEIFLHYGSGVEDYAR